MRRDSIFNDATKMPWPVGVGFAAVVFFVFHTHQLVAPQIQLSPPFFPAIKMLVYLFIVIFFCCIVFIIPHEKDLGTAGSSDSKCMDELPACNR